MVYSDYLKLRLIFLARKVYKAPTISKMLKKVKLSCTRKNVYLFLKRYRYEETHSISRKQGSGRLSKVTAEIEALVTSASISAVTLDNRPSQALRFQPSLWIIDQNLVFDQWIVMSKKKCARTMKLQCTVAFSRLLNHHLLD